MALLAENVPKYRRKLVRLEGQAHVDGPLDDEVLGLADLGNAGQIALDVGCENRNTGARKSLGHDLQRHGLAGSSRAGDQTVAIAKRKRQPRRLLTLADENLLVGIVPSRCRMSPSLPSVAVAIKLNYFKSHHTACCGAIDTGQSPAWKPAIAASA